MNKKFLVGIIALFFSAATLSAQENVFQSYDLDEVVVTATRMGLPLKSIPQKVEIISRQKILGIPADNAAELLKRVTNLDIIQYPGISAQVGMRGFSPTAHARSYTLVLIDGLPSGTSNLATLPTSIIERIEVIKGPYSVLYGTDAMGGVINIITKKSSIKKSAEIGLKAGSFGTKKFDVSASGLLSEKVGVVLGFSHHTQDKDYRIGSKNLLKTSDLEKIILDEKSYGDIYPNTTFEMSQIFGKLNYRINNQWNFSLASFYNMAYDVKTPGNYFARKAQKKDISRLNLFGHLTRTTTNNKSTIAPYYSNEKNANYDKADLSPDNFISFKDNVSQYGLKINNTHVFNNLSLLLGVDYDVRDYTSERQKKKGTTTYPYQPDNRNQQFSGIGQLNYEIDHLSVNAGVRANYNKYDIFANDSLKNKASSDNYFNLMPSAGLKYNFDNGINLHASVGKAFSVPDAFKIAGSYKVEEYFPDWNYWWRNVYVSNPDLKPETSITYDVGIGFNNNGISVDATYFTTNHKNKIIPDLSQKGDTTRHTNAEKAFMNGLEFIGAIDLGFLAGSKSKLEVYAGYTFLFNAHFTSRKSKTTETIVTRDLLYVAKSNGNFGIAYDNKKGFTTRLNARYMGSRLEEDLMKGLRPQIKQTDYYTKAGWEIVDKNDKRILKQAPHLIFDYSAYLHVTPNARVGISISNLFDENYAEKDGYNMPGRSIMGSFNYTF